MEIIGKVILMGLFFAVIGIAMSILSFLYKMLNPKFRKQYFHFRDICGKLKLSGNLDLLEKFKTAISDKPKYHFFYENANRISDDELYNSNFDNYRKRYIKIIETVNYFSLESCLKRSLRKNKSSDKPLIKYLINEIDEISTDFNNNDLSNKVKILKSKKRFIDYLLENNTENEQYLKTLLENIKVKTK